MWVAYWQKYVLKYKSFLGVYKMKLSDCKSPCISISIILMAFLMASCAEQIPTDQTLSENALPYQLTGKARVIERLPRANLYKPYIPY